MLIVKSLATHTKRKQTIFLIIRVLLVQGSCFLFRVYCVCSWQMPLWRMFVAECFPGLGGNFNCSYNDIDRKHTYLHPAWGCGPLRLDETNEHYDVWRNLHNNARQHTRAIVRNHSISGNILLLWASIPMLMYLSRRFFYHHFMIVVCAHINYIKHKSALWHLNSALLKIFV